MRPDMEAAKSTHGGDCSRAVRGVVCPVQHPRCLRRRPKPAGQTSTVSLDTQFVNPFFRAARNR